MERCPQCHGRLRGSSRCGRCGAELDLLYAIEAGADIRARRAVKALLAGDGTGALNLATTACRLHATPFHQALTGFLAGEICREEK